jgi:hypothetical protein
MREIFHLGHVDHEMVVFFPVGLLLLLLFIVLLDLGLAICHNYDEGVSGCHLVHGVHHDFVGGVVQDEEDDYGFGILLAFDQSDGAVLHFTGTQSFGVDVVELFDLQGGFLSDSQGLSLGEEVNGLSLVDELSEFGTFDLGGVKSFLNHFGHREEFFSDFRDGFIAG